jgi:alpha-beta hydrolase superfamily lysophospholipase
MERYTETKDGLMLWTESFDNPENPSVLLIMAAMNQGLFRPDEFFERFSSTDFHVIRYDHRDTGKSATVDYQRPALTEQLFGAVFGEIGYPDQSTENGYPCLGLRATA